MTEHWTPRVSESLFGGVKLAGHAGSTSTQGEQVRILHVVPAVALFVAACGGDSTSPTVNASGSMSFTFTGAGTNGSSTYNASGAPPANPNTTFGTSAWAARSTQTANEFDAVAAIPRSSTTWDIAGVTTPSQTTGTFTINANCTAANCASVAYIVGATQNEQSFTFICSLTTGSIVVTSISSSRAAGTFSGTGTCLTAAFASSSFAITNGSFDVPLAQVVFGRTTLLGKKLVR